MIQLWTQVAVTLVATVFAFSAAAQTSYSPGQTFSAGSQAATPHSPVPRQQQPQFVTPPAVQVQSRPAPSTPIYNMTATPKSRTSSQPIGKPSSAPKLSSGLAKASQKIKDVPNEQTNEKPVESKPLLPEISQRTDVRESASVKSKPDIKVTPEAIALPESTDKLVFFSRKTGKKQIALTYDDGPNPSYTSKLTEYLKANNVPATFFLCGNMVKEHPDSVKKLAADGFELANHSYDHPSLNKLSREKVQDQLQDTHDLIKEVSGIDVKLMRPPYGAKNKTVEEVCETMGYKIIQWDIDTEDWKKRSTAFMVNLIMKKATDGSIILMHDRKHGGTDNVLDTTRQIVDQLRAKGYTFVTVGELIGVAKNSPAIAEPAVLPVTSSTVVQNPLSTPAPIQ